MPPESDVSRRLSECETERRDLCERLSSIELSREREAGAAENFDRWRHWVTRECNRSKRHRAKARERWRQERRRWKAILAICSGSAGGGAGLVYLLRHLPIW